MRRNAMKPFEIKDCTLLQKMSGLPAAINLRELRDRIASCSRNVLYHHFCETLLAPAFDYPEYRNDFAVWANRRLGDEILAERLGIIDPYASASMDELRKVVLDIFDERLNEAETVPSASRGNEFYFMETTLVVFDTGQRISHPDELPSSIQNMTNSSLYFHVLEARRRPVKGLDDFSTWLQTSKGTWDHYISAIRSLDVMFFTLAEIKSELIRLLEAARVASGAGKRK
jgi:hypothetical protein